MDCSAGRGLEGVNSDCVQHSSCLLVPLDPRNLPVWFWIEDNKGVDRIIDINETIHELKPRSAIKLPLINAKILEKAGLGKILQNKDEIIEKVFLPRAEDSGIPSPVGVGRREPADVHLETAGTSGPVKRHATNTPSRVRYVRDLSEVDLGEVVFLENYCDVVPSPQLLELARKAGLPDELFWGQKSGGRKYRCEKGHLVVIPFIRGNKFNPAILQKRAKDSARELALKLCEFNEKAPVIQRRGGAWHSVKGSRRVYVLPFELTYPPEIEDLLLKIAYNDYEELQKLSARAVEVFMQKFVNVEFGVHAPFTELIFWNNLHIWSSKNPSACNFHEHIQLLNVVFDLRGSDIFIAMREVFDDVLTPKLSDFVEYLSAWGYSRTTVKRFLGRFCKMGLINYSPRGRFYTCVEPSLPSPLIRFNPKKFRASKLGLYRQLWKEAIEETFNVKLCDLPVVHLPDEVIPCTYDNIPKLKHRLGYCGRHPLVDLQSYLKKLDEEGKKGDIDPEWFKLLLFYRNKRFSSRIARKLSKYTYVDFLSTKESRLNRLKKQHEDELRERERLKKVIAELTELKDTSSDDVELSLIYAEKLEDVKKRLNEINRKLEKYDRLRSEIVSERDRIRNLTKTCPVCGGVMKEVGQVSVVEGLPLIYFDSHAKQWAIVWENG
jgi:hypothetical protein